MAHLKKEKGDIGVAKVIADLTVRRWNVCLPLTEHAKYDMIAEKDGKLVRVQVRFTTSKNGTIAVRLSSTWNDKHGSHRVNRKSGDYDLLAIYCPNTDLVYYAWDKDFSNTKAIQLRLDATKNNQATNVRMASDYLTL